MANIRLPLYKFLNEKHVPALLARGTLRIGTAAEYRVPDDIDAGRSDPAELVTQWAPGARTIAVDRNHEFVKAVGANLPKGKTLHLSFAAETRFLIEANAYIFCASARITEDLRNRMKRDFDADACVRIHFPLQFASLLSQHASLKNKRCDIREVSYGDESIVAEYEGDDPFLKQKKFAWQEEVRIAWTGEEISEKGMLIDVPSIIPLVERLFFSLCSVGNARQSAVDWGFGAAG